MADKRFFTLAGPFTLTQLAQLTGSELSDPARGSAVMKDVATLDLAQAEHITFLDNKKYLEAFRATKAGAVFTRAEAVPFAPAGTVCLVHKNPYKAYAVAAQAFYPDEKPAPRVAPSAVIDPTATIGADCVIEEGVVIGAHVKIGKGTRVQAHAVIRQGVEMGEGCDIGSNSYVTHAIIGNKVRLHPGVSVGRPGFGFAIDPATGFTSVPQLGRVMIGDFVEIGANSTIDRGAGTDTVIGQGTRIDNLVQLGHNVQIGKYCVIVAQTGVAGSTQVGDFSMLGGQSGIAGHLKIGAKAQVAAQSGVMRDIPDGVAVMGSPAVPIKQNMRQVAALAKLAGGKKRSEEQ